MAVKNPTTWTPPSGEGYVTPSSGASITTLSGSTLTTLTGSSIIIEAETYQPKYATDWDESSKNTTSWKPPSGSGYVIDLGAYFLITNDNFFLITNSGDNLVTTPTYDIAKYPTAWSQSGV